MRERNTLTHLNSLWSEKVCDRRCGEGRQRQRKIQFTGNLLFFHTVKWGKGSGWNQRKLKSPLSYLTCLPTSNLTFSTTWCTNQNTGGGPPRSYLVCIDSEYYGLCMPAGLLHKHSKRCLPLPPWEQKQNNTNATWTIWIIKTQSLWQKHTSAGPATKYFTKPTATQERNRIPCEFCIVFSYKVSHCAPRHIPIFRPTC